LVGFVEGFARLRQDSITHGVSGFNLDRLARGGDGSVGVSRLEPRIARRTRQCEIAWGCAMRTFKHLGRLIKSFLHEQHIRQPGKRRRVVGGQGERLSQRRLGIGVSLLDVKGQPQICDRINLPPIQGERLFVALDGFWQSAQFSPGCAQIVECRGVGGQFDRPADDLHREVALAALEGNNAQMMQSVGLFGYDSKNLAIKPLGLGQSSG
jgi:hypothetical protein